MAGHRPSSRKKILAAAADLARQSGPVRFSLDAVARHPGVSKGGLLYNFPTKAKLMQGLVEDYLGEFEEALDAASGPDKEESLLAAYVRLSAKECESAQPAAAGTPGPYPVIGSRRNCSAAGRAWSIAVSRSRRSARWRRSRRRWRRRGRSGRPGTR